MENDLRRGIDDRVVRVRANACVNTCSVANCRVESGAGDSNCFTCSDVESEEKQSAVC